MVQNANYFREKAEQCRSLARSIPVENDPAATALHAMAVEFDAQVTAIEACTATAKMDGYEGSPLKAHHDDSDAQVIVHDSVCAA